MCGRFTLRATLAEVAEHFQLDSLPSWDWNARFNIAPTQEIAAVRLGPTGARQLAQLRWGLVPSWANDPSIGNRMINARAETVATKPSFRSAFRRRRCIVPADGYYEWERSDEGKRPVLIEHVGHELFGIAGIWETWQSPEGTSVESVALITTGANRRTRAIHDRMPAMIPREAYDQWLGIEPVSADRWQQLLAPDDTIPLMLTRVSTYVNHPSHEGPRCVAAEAGTAPADSAPTLPFCSHDN